MPHVYGGVASLPCVNSLRTLAQGLLAELTEVQGLGKDMHCGMKCCALAAALLPAASLFLRIDSAGSSSYRGGCQGVCNDAEQCSAPPLLLRVH